ncbi:MAG: anti-sigma F factor, partial [Oscillospiraceae bacterium]|nr:anti-sigma F factor [Oscillospiraceae bacterium]
MKREILNEARIRFPSYSVNESFACSAAAAFAAAADPTVQEISEIKTAVSEAVTNAIVHGYRDTVGEVELTLRRYSDNTLYISVKDKGRGIEDIGQAMTPLFTTAAEEERSGLGFSVMESFTDRLKVKSSAGKG